VIELTEVAEVRFGAAVTNDRDQAGLRVVEAPEPGGADLLLSGDRVLVCAPAPGRPGS